MARKFNERYVRYYTFGSAAAKLDRDERRATLPKYKDPSKRKPLAVDPVSLVGNVVVVVLAVLMIVGMIQMAFTAAQVQALQTRVTALEQEQQMLVEQYEGSYDLNQIRAAAESMGMIPLEEAARVRVEVPAETVQVQQLSWWDTMLQSLRQLFA